MTFFPPFPPFLLAFHLLSRTCPNKSVTVSGCYHPQERQKTFPVCDLMIRQLNSSAASGQHRKDAIYLFILSMQSVCLIFNFTCQTQFSLLIAFTCRKVAVINLDPANDALPYLCCEDFFIDIILFQIVFVFTNCLSYELSLCVERSIFAFFNP